MADKPQLITLRELLKLRQVIVDNVLVGKKGCVIVMSDGCRLVYGEKLK